MKEFLNLQGVITFLNNIKLWALSTFRTEEQVQEQLDNSGFIYSTEIDSVLDEVKLDADTLQGHDSTYFAAANHTHDDYDVRGTADEALLEAKNYTDEELASLVGTAPEMMNTIEELANAIKNHQEVTDILNDAIITKADKSVVDGIVNGSTSVPNAVNAQTLDGLDSTELERTLLSSETNTLVTINNSHTGTAEVEGLIHNEIPYPYYDTTKTVNGITWTDNGDGTITANGTATINSTFFLYKGNRADKFNGMVISGGFDSDKYLSVEMVESPWTSYASDYGNSDIVENVPSDVAVYVFARVAQGATATNLIFKPMLTKGTTPQPYVPYTYEVRSVGKNLAYTQPTGSMGNINFNNMDFANGITASAILTINDDRTYPRLDVTFYYTDGSSDNHRANYTATKGTPQFLSCSAVPNLNKTLTRLAVNFADYSTGSLPNGFVIEEPQIEIGTEFTGYEPPVLDTFPVTPTTDKAYVKTYNGVTNIFTDYNIPLTVNYGTTPNGAKLNEGVQANAFIHAEDFMTKTTPRKNLLDNPRFKVNQRGENRYEGATRTVDRWATGTSSGSVSVAENGVVISATDGYSFVQYYSQETNNSMVGNIVTLSVLFDDNKLHAITWNYDDSGYIAENIKSGVSIGLFTDSKIVQFYLSPNTTINIKAVKLEIGSTQTLCYHDGSKWVLYDDYDKNLDEINCKKYLLVFEDSPWFNGRTRENGVNFVIPTTLKMNAKPTITTTGRVECFYNGELIRKENSLITFTTGDTGSSIKVQITYTDSTTLTPNHACCVGISGKLIVSAEL